MFWGRHFLLFVYLVLFAASCVSVLPKNLNSPSYSDSIALKKHVSELTKINYRQYLDTTVLNKTAKYIELEFLKITEKVSTQTYQTGGREYKNIICSLGPDDGERIVIGAHYDVCGNQPGADDNASGVAGMLELTRLLKDQDLKYRIDFVAYTLEEPPYFSSNNMGSYIHAKYMYDNEIPVKGMICLEMIGYFNNTPHSQSYPVGIMKWFYGGTGNYILIAQRFGNGSFGRQFNRSIRKTATLETKFLRSPKVITGVDFSDHRNYWYFGYNALMVTNTAFYRNKNYHTTGDTKETLDYKRMSKVVDEVYLTILNLK